MKNWSTDKIIAVGLMGTFAVTIVCMDIVAVMHGDMSIEAIAKELAIGLFSYMSRGLATTQAPTDTKEAVKQAVISEAVQALTKKAQKKE